MIIVNTCQKINNSDVGGYTDCSVPHINLTEVPFHERTTFTMNLYVLNVRLQTKEIIHFCLLLLIF